MLLYEHNFSYSYYISLVVISNLYMTYMSSKDHWKLIQFTVFNVKAEANRSNISSNITKFLCWMKCWTSLADLKFLKRRKKCVGWCWMKFWSPSNISSNIFPSFQRILDVGYVWSLFHPTFYYNRTFESIFEQNKFDYKSSFCFHLNEKKDENEWTQMWNKQVGCQRLNSFLFTYNIHPTSSNFSSNMLDEMLDWFASALRKYSFKTFYFIE